MKCVKLMIVLCAYLLLSITITANSIANTIGANKVDSHKNNKATISDMKDDPESNPHFYMFYLYQPMYFLADIYTHKPFRQFLGNQEIKQHQAQFQISFKAMILHHILGSPASLYFGYTQLSIWQIYVSSAYFSETDYQPEIFVAMPFHHHFHADVGVAHQSNGTGGVRERSWNRAYVDFSWRSPNQHWLVSIKPWCIFHDRSLKDHNPDIGDYLGHGRLLVAFRAFKQVISLSLRNNLESGFHHGAQQLTWSFPLFGSLRGYVQLFSGYGRTLEQYRHYTNTAGIGISVNDWFNNLYA